MLENRMQLRVKADIAVKLISVLDMKDGRIIDLSEGGAQIVGSSFPKGTRFQIDWQEQTLYAQVMWDEVDRMGVRFEYPLKDGPLYEEMRRLMAPAAEPRAYVGLTPMRSSGFGRRAA